MNKEEFEKRLGYVADTTLSCIQTCRLLCEYDSLNKKKEILLIDYKSYFQYVYGKIGNYLILEMSKIYDNGPDCVRFDNLKNEVFMDFDNIFPLSHDYYNNPQKTFSETSKSDFFKQYQIYRNKINDTLEKIQYIRNKAGLAHGMYPDFSEILSIGEIKNFLDYTARIINMFYNRYNNTEIAFNDAIYKVKDLTNLAEEYRSLKN